MPAAGVTAHKALGTSFFMPPDSGRRRPLGVRQPWRQPWPPDVPAPLCTRVLLFPAPLSSSPSAGLVSPRGSQSPSAARPAQGPSCRRCPKGARVKRAADPPGRGTGSGAASRLLPSLAASCPPWGTAPGRVLPRVRAASGQAPPCPQLSLGDARCCSAPPGPGRGGCWGETLLVSQSLVQPDTLFLALLQMATCPGPCCCTCEYPCPSPPSPLLPGSAPTPLGTQRSTPGWCRGWVRRGSGTGSSLPGLWSLARPDAAQMLLVTRGDGLGLPPHGAHPTPVAGRRRMGWWTPESVDVLREKGQWWQQGLALALAWGGGGDRGAQPAHSTRLFLAGTLTSTMTLSFTVGAEGTVTTAPPPSAGCCSLARAGTRPSPPAPSPFPFLPPPAAIPPLPGTPLPFSSRQVRDAPFPITGTSPSWPCSRHLMPVPGTP